MDDDLCTRLQAAARLTALTWDLARVGDDLEALLHGAAAAGKELLSLRTHPLVAATARDVCLEAIAVAVATPGQ